MPLWIFTSARVCPLALNSTLQFSIAFTMQFKFLSDILYIFRHSIIQVFETMLNHAMATFSALFWLRWICADPYMVGHLFFLFPCGILSGFSEIVRGNQASNVFLLLTMWFGFSISWVSTLLVYSCWGWFIFFPFRCLFGDADFFLAFT